MKLLGLDLDGVWWWLSSGLMKIINWLEKAFNFLVGSDMVDVTSNGGTGGTTNNLFVSIMTDTEQGTNLTKIYFYIMLLCVAFMLFFIAIGAIKAQFAKSPTDSLKNLGFKSFFAFIQNNFQEKGLSYSFERF